MDIQPHRERHLRDIREGSLPTCLVCDAVTNLFDVVDLYKSCEGFPDGLSGTPIYYVRCTRCGYAFTDFFRDFTGPDWQDLIYNDRYYERIDPDYSERRPAHNAEQIATILRGRKAVAIGLDYGGGNGRTVQHLRSMGFAFDCYDPFGTTDLTPDRRGHYNFCSAIEVAEHTPDPRSMLTEMLDLCTKGPLMILIGTLTQDKCTADPLRLNWWYSSPRNGHIGLFTRAALEILGENEGLECISFNQSQHVFFRGHSRRSVQREILRNKALAKVTALRRRLTGSDG